MDLFSNLQLLHEAAISVLITTIYGRWRTITISMLFHHKTEKYVNQNYDILSSTK